MASNLEMIVSARAHVQLSNMHCTETHLKVPNGGNNEKTALFKYKLLDMNRAEWGKGICHIWFSGRHFSPSMPGNGHLKLRSQKRSPGRNLGEHRSVRRSGTTSAGTPLLAFVCACAVSLELKFPLYSWAENMHAESDKQHKLLLVLVS